MARSPGKRGGELGASPTVVTGTLGDPGDDDRLDVTFTIREGTVRLRAGDQEIGSWSIDDVSMTQGGQSLWYFEAEGDRLPFVPTRPAALEASELTATHTDDRRGRRRGRRPRSVGATSPTPTRAVPDSRADVPSDGSPEPKPRKPRKPPRRRLRVPALSDMPAIPKLRRTPSRSTSGDTSDPGDADPLRTRLWLGTVDAARRRGWFGLDRLPVNLRDRHGEHLHTWDHPAAASSGPAQHVCTICGSVRF